MLSDRVFEPISGHNANNNGYRDGLANFERFPLGAAILMNVNESFIRERLDSDYYLCVFSFLCELKFQRWERAPRIISNESKSLSLARTKTDSWL